ncbi:hypothetical protein FN976_02105 [Caenimonas sedimenti]|uniref:Uncharacterized protein n=1 Tax=Caenimonas sedimenti TaxID=2596921 RepID=A0A562ZWQ7_9BURK|nr:hypothetical protein [Caenimonas sedimenti]TWO73052.1 hypothetical protein FN976_02105 [Caenimonas sedimenti]
MTQPNRPWAVMLLLVALVFAQAMGFAHRVAHADGGPGQDLVAADHHHHADAPSHPHADATWQQVLFGLHEDGADCRLYDGLGSHALACQSAVAAAVIAPGAAFLRSLAGDFVARWVTLFDARGPPSSR